MNEENSGTDACPICKSTEKRRPLCRGTVEFMWECMQCGRLYNPVGYNRHEPEEFERFSRMDLINKITEYKECLFEARISASEDKERLQYTIESLEYEKFNLEEKIKELEEDIRMR